MKSSVLSATPVQTCRIGVVGLRFGQSILNQLAQEPARKHFSLAAVCDMNLDVAAEVGSKWGVPHHSSLDALIEDKEIDVVGLFTKPAGRAELLRRIIRAGKDVMTTKPFEIDPDEAASVLAEARESGRVIHLNSPSAIPTADLRLVKQWREIYSLGRPIAARAALWASYREEADGSWMDDPKQCPAAPLFRLGIYLLNDIGYILGTPELVQVMASTIRTGRPTPDNAQMTIRYQNQALGYVSASFCVDDGDEYQNGLVLQFENGTIYRNMGGMRAQPPRPNVAEMILIQRGKKGRQIREVTQIEEWSGDYQWSALATAIRRKEGMDESYIARILDSVRIIDALQRAQRDGTVRISAGRALNPV